MKHCLASLVLLSLLSCPGWADEPKAAPLSKQEIADGWIMLFDGETFFGWRAADGSKWTALEGMLAPQGKTPSTLVTTTEFNEFELRLQYQVRADSKASLLVACDADARERPPRGLVELRRLTNTWHDLLVTVRGANLSSEVRSSSFLGGAFATASQGAGIKLGPGHLALSGTGLVVRNVRLLPLGTQPIFNGKDLTGWKEFKGDKYKSKFTVTPEGWINVKNGPGDLQTEGQWADFVLQAECISNGKQLNSGIFFRARPGEYQQGYEAQIHNGFTDEPKKDYVLEEYDPKTHELKDKKKEKYTAIDYGTGAIYRRMPARRELAKDHEWFTMTVVAQGNHLATWVNGIQAVDWTDNRPLKDNARNGCCLEKGAISIQGHDPTTDLSFRNLRLAELPKKN
jgi:hypothetical protein